MSTPRSPVSPSARVMLPYVLLALASLFWSGNHVVGRAIAGLIPPVGISAARWIIPAIVLLPFARKYLAADWPAIRSHWKAIVWLGLIGGALFSAMQYVGLQYTTALNVSVLNSLVPVLIVGAGTVIFGDRITWRQMCGIAISLLGVLVIVGQGSLTRLWQLSFNSGDIIILFNMALFAVYAASLRLRPPMHWMSFIYLLALISALATLPFAVWEAAAGAVMVVTPMTIAAVIFVAIFPSVLAYAAWNTGVELIGANRSGPFLHLVPVYSAALAWMFLGEPIMAFHAAGLMLILAGVWLASR